MGLIYTAVVEQIAVTAIQDFLEITAPSDSIVKILSARLGQNSDPADAQAELLPVQITRYATGGSGGTAAIAANPHEVGSPTKGSTVDRNNTTQGGTPLVIVADVFNVQAGWIYQPPPEEQIIISPLGILAIELPVAPADELTMSGSITFEEIGG